LTGAPDHGKGSAEFLAETPAKGKANSHKSTRTLARKEINVVKPEWGTKRTCPKCGTRFYDLQKTNPVVCIDCGNEWVPEPILKTKQPIPVEEVKDETPDANEDEDINVDDDDIGDVSLDDDDDEEVSSMVDTSLSDDES